jgi:hypothetical protein
MSGKWNKNTDLSVRSEDSDEHHYDPQDANSETGLRRPPDIAGCVLDYFIELGKIEDDGKLAHDEMAALLADPAKFFGR